MSVTVDIFVESPLWADEPAAEETVQRAVEAALAAVDAGQAEVSAVLTDDARIQALNSRWRGQDKPTNVLSFPAPEDPAEPRFLGDIVLAFETIRREAQQEEKALLHHLAHLAVHGTLHLLGYDHEHESDAIRMEDQERKILSRLGISDPYAPVAAERAEQA